MDNKTLHVVSCRNCLWILIFVVAVKICLGSPHTFSEDLDLSPDFIASSSFLLPGRQLKCLGPWHSCGRAGFNSLTPGLSLTQHWLFSYLWKILDFPPPCHFLPFVIVLPLLNYLVEFWSSYSLCLIDIWNGIPQIHLIFLLVYLFFVILMCL